MSAGTGQRPVSIWTALVTVIDDRGSDVTDDHGRDPILPRTTDARTGKQTLQRYCYQGRVLTCDTSMRVVN
ncbi:hypothetical protein C474_19095 [Halogeometricum pallidum JCM 14848]|uniref:Uncharacterized protein n=1 Tax=Halogeometricum pallidum JCM 14848 TaxID=1227487 RepID=M0CVV1_HALPD|nr:hypothetical protein [Halogeometricum pallidum]ELZ26778.1 hypothetical protein C474_19095 [Halogeometricum pallidum JCM 14848]